MLGPRGPTTVAYAESGEGSGQTFAYFSCFGVKRVQL